ncbi:MAG: (deoxy)nucleoside triphosphate pyrophosphohydrolase [Spirochaetaceae bacterium]|jgi:8-oxo-dGTP diphosphatase|nr:(deoxy)nucleoside triphosphate pyrophosphohydrolase [Spirochaetaceae bacterium]
MKERISVAGVAVRTFPQEPRRQKFFVARRLSGGSLGGKWEFPGGKVESGETDQEALIREFQEELAVPVEVGSFIGETEFIHGDTLFTLRFYRITLLSDDYTLTAHSEWRWVSMDEMIQLDFAESDRKLFPAIIKKRESLKTSVFRDLPLKN